jgi:toxin ParE1/3/4
LTELVLRPEAERDLLEIEDYSLRTHGVRRAETYLADIYKAFRFLRDHPEAGAIHPAVRPAIRSWPIGKHRIYYDYQGTKVEVSRVLHQAMDPEEHI